MITAAFHDRRVRWIAIALVVLNLWFITAQPVVVIAGAAHDDRLFVTMAERIVGGQWLGDYTQMTFAKGPGYPLFIAFAFVLGIPLPLAEHGLYLLGCWLLIRALRPLLRHDGWALLLLAGIVWQPMIYVMPDVWGGSVLRQNLYTPLTVLIFAGVIALYTRRNERPLVRSGWALLLGVSAAWFWITREEGVWILPSVAVLLLASVLRRHEPVEFGKSGDRPAPVGTRPAVGEDATASPTAIAALVWPWLLGAAVMCLGVGTVCAINYRHYGWFGECEFHAADFRDAYGALSRVKVGEFKLRFPVTKAMRAATYPYSPSFAEMKELIEHQITRDWAGAEDREINGGMWMWALRDAVRDAGHAPNPTAALAFYRQLEQEVNAACDAGKIPSGPHHSSFLPPWNSAYTHEAKEQFWPFARRFFTWEAFRARPPASQSHGDASLMNVFHDMTQWPLAPSADEPARDTPRTKALRAWRIGALQSIGDAVRWPIVASTALGFVLWLWAAGAAVWRRRLPDYLWWVATSALGGACAVWIISFLVHVTSWFDMRPLRFSQGYPLLVLFAGAAIVNACRRRAATTATT